MDTVIHHKKIYGVGQANKRSIKQTDTSIF